MNKGTIDSVRATALNRTTQELKGVGTIACRQSYRPLNRTTQELKGALKGFHEKGIGALNRTTQELKYG